MICCSCGKSDKEMAGKEVKGKMSIEVEPFGTTEDGQQVELYTLTNTNGMKVQIATYGGIVTSLQVPDRNGKLGDVVLGYDSLDGYVKNNPYFGCIVGRYGNRIAKGKFTIEGQEYTLATNNNENHLHGGIRGFDKAVWKAEKVEGQGEVGVRLSYLSKDGEEGYPGNLDVTVVYTLTDDNELRIDYQATTDKTTHCNLTHHGYFNLTECAQDILGHEMMINADKFTPVDAGLIPTGELAEVEGTVMDFREPTAIGAGVDSDYEQIKFGGGYDHNWVLNRDSQGMTLAATVHEPTTGRVMEVLTTEPGIQFYCGNFLDGTITGKKGTVYKHRWGFCLETQHYPDSPNQPDFPSTLLKPGQKYETTTVYRFSAR